MVEAVSRLHSESQAWQQILIFLKKRSVGRGSGGECKATKGHGLWVVVMCPQPHPHHSPNQLWATTIWRLWQAAQPNGQLAQIGNEVRQPQGWPYGQLRAAKKPQQEHGQGAAQMPQNIMGGLRGCRSGHRRDRSGYRRLESCRRLGKCSTTGVQGGWGG